MKLVDIVIYFLMLLYSSVKSETMEEIDNLVTNCLKKYPVADDEFARFRELEKDPSLASDNYKCFGMCVVQGRGWFIGDVLADHVFIKAVGGGRLAKRGDELHHITKKCKLLVGDNKCDTVFQVTNCLQEKINQLLQLVKSF
uniref:Odorant binding protein n=1 Tax=Stomoxys calcitrans TaxID=35570 RepID=A0A1I8P345_STOCA